MTDLKIVEGGLLDMVQTCEYLNIKKDTLYQLCFKRRIPIVKIGRLNRFRKQDLDQWIESNMQGVNTNE
ncbi:MAG: helix-turn-helix domain-containing protein [Candidatus Brocadiaceae bacterium]